MKMNVFLKVSLLMSAAFTSLFMLGMDPLREPKDFDSLLRKRRNSKLRKLVKSGNVTSMITPDDIKIIVGEKPDDFDAEIYKNDMKRIYLLLIGGDVDEKTGFVLLASERNSLSSEIDYAKLELIQLRENYIELRDAGETEMMRERGNDMDKKRSEIESKRKYRSSQVDSSITRIRDLIKEIVEKYASNLVATNFLRKLYE